MNIVIYMYEIVGPKMYTKQGSQSGSGTREIKRNKEWRESHQAKWKTNPAQIDHLFVLRLPAGGAYGS
jgi:hypothetical protein